MRLLGLLNFYDEPPDQIITCVRGLHRCGVEHIIAVDGAYALFPNGDSTSHPNQHAALDLVCVHLGIGLTLHVPREVWAGNEVEKRSFLFALAWTCADPGDWFFVMDADQEVTEVPADLRERLGTTKYDVGETNFFDTVAARANEPNWSPNFTVRNLFRAQPIHLETNHITYITEDGRYLWGGPNTYSAAPSQLTKLEVALDVTDLLVVHRPDKRPPTRQAAKLAYYKNRDEERIERGECRSCGEPSARLVAIRWRKSKIGPIADWLEVCEPCGKRYDKIGRIQLLQLGFDPDKVTIENRNGRPPHQVKNRIVAA